MWLLSLGLIALCVYLPYDYTKEGGVITSSWNPTQRAAFETLTKTAWALAVSWIIYAANNNCGGRDLSPVSSGHVIVGVTYVFIGQGLLIA